MWLGIFVGGILTVFLMLYRVRGSILMCIFLVSIISWPRNTAVTYFPHTPAGDDLFDFFKQVVTFRPLRKIGAAIEVGSEYCQARINTQFTALFLVVKLQERPCMVCARYCKYQEIYCGFNTPLIPLSVLICRHSRYHGYSLLHGQVRRPPRPSHPGL